MSDDVQEMKLWRVECHMCGRAVFVVNDTAPDEPPYGWWELLTDEWWCDRHGVDADDISHKRYPLILEGPID